ncbi:MAG: serine/threonine protein kinase [Xenococcaceae cyanobacterium]
MSKSLDFSQSPYQVIRKLGQNRVGGRVTYLATDTTTEKPVVLKQFQFAQPGSDWSGFKAYEREIQVLRSLNHPSIPRYLNSFETSKGFCMVQEYKDAQSLAVPRSFEPSQIKQIAISILEILIYLQNQTPPIIHRDIKPENILVNDQLNVYLVDFGFSRLGSGEGAISSVAAGTFGFMAPEQIYNRQLSKATDLYGLGATLICLLTGTKSTAIDSLIDEDNCLNFKHLVPQLSRTFIDWLQRMVQPNKKDRYPCAADAKASLGLIYVSSIPEVQLRESSLEFKATQLGQKLAQTLRISNVLPDSVKEGTWEVAPHPSDPPHSPDFHSWISFDPPRFARHQAEVKITVDSSKLMAARTYERQIFLHKHSVPEINYSLTVKVHTASLPRVNNKRLYGFLAGLFLICWAGTAIFAIDVGWIRNMLGVALFVAGAVFGARTGWGGVKLAFWFEGIPLAVLGFVGFYIRISDPPETVLRAMSAVISMVLHVALKAFVGVIAGTLARKAFKMIGAGARSGTQTVVMPGTVVWKHLKTEFGTILAVAILLLTAGLGLSLGMGFNLGFLNPLIVSAVLAISLPLAWMIIYLPITRHRLIAKYRQSEQHLIKP